MVSPLSHFPPPLVVLSALLCQVLCWGALPLAAQQIPPPKRVRLVFQLHAPDLPSETKVYLAGSLKELGNWQPDQVLMNACGNHRWGYCLEVEPTKAIEYKYTLGSWQREGADAQGQPLSNFVLHADQNATAQDEVLFWSKPQPPKIVGQITGELRYHRQLEFEGLQPRDLIVWLPPGYETSEQRYPVLYMHDGQNLFDPRTSAFRVDWQVDETCTELIAAEKIPPLIVVGISNTSDRTKEYLPSELGKKYQQMILEEIKPLVDREYRTKSTREHTFVGGSSAGGLCAMMLAWEHPEVFSGALCFSPALRIENKHRNISLNYVQTVEDSPPPKHPLFFYFDNGGIGLEATLQPGIEAMLEALSDKGFRKNEDFVWVLDKDARHTESAWADRFPAAVQSLFDHTHRH